MQLIVSRLEDMGRLDLLRKVHPPADWSNSKEGTEENLQGGPENVMTESRLKKVLQRGDFAVTAECGPPKGADPEVVKSKGRVLKGHVDSVNVTDNQTGVVRLCSLAACALLKTEGLDPVLQMVTVTVIV